MHQGGTFLIRIRLAAGSNRGWVPLMISFPGQVNISVARKDMNQTLEVSLILRLASCTVYLYIQTVLGHFLHVLDPLMRVSLILCSLSGRF